MNPLDLVKKYQRILAYLFFGVVTTVLNMAGYYVCYHLWGWSSDASTVTAWILAVAVAFVTNKPLVFGSTDWSVQVLVKEIWSFLGCRIGTGVVELVMMHVLVEAMGLPGMLMKFLTNVVVVILNYIASKLVVFRKNDRQAV